jgi:hypothetical protein
MSEILEPSSSRWEEVKDAFQEILDAPLEDRQRLLTAMDSRDPCLSASVRQLLDELEEAGDFLELDDDDDRPVFAPSDRLAGRFVITRLIGAGGMGEVYEAYDETLQETVAIKTMRRVLLQSDAARARFVAEVQRARKVTHRNVCRIFDIFEH